MTRTSQQSAGRRSLHRPRSTAPDAIIITHSAFKRIGVTEASVAPIRNEIVTDLEMELSSLAEDQGTRVPPQSARAAD